MEPFFDGGLFEILFAALFVLTVNFVFARKYLLYIFFVIAIGAPVTLLFYHKGEWMDVLVLVCLFNAVFLVVLLMRAKKDRPEEALIQFDYKRTMQKFADKFHFKKQSTINKI